MNNMGGSEAGTLTRDYGTENLEELADRYAALEKLLVSSTWPEGIQSGPYVGHCDLLVDVNSRLRDSILAKPSRELSDIRGKLKYLIVRLAFDDYDLQDVVDALTMVSGEVAAIKRAEFDTCFGSAA